MTSSTRILVVDRDEDFVNELTNFLLASGYRNILSVSNYKDALNVLKQNHTDIVLMEIYAPDLKGFDYALGFKSLKPETKIFLMIEPEYQPVVNERNKLEGQFECLMKPTIAEDLLRYLRG